jgi:aspartyl protease family protein
MRRRGLLFVASLFASGALAAQVSVVGLFKDRAMVSIDGGKPRLIVVGQTTPEGVKLIAANSSQATFEVDGRPQVLVMGQSAASSTAPATDRSTVHITADVNGHFSSLGAIDGSSLRFLIDTGASLVAINAEDARRIGVRYQDSERQAVATANGAVTGYMVTFNSVKLGDITLHQVQGMVVETAMPVALLGMSFLNRVDMKREGSTMTLSKRY